VAQHELAAVGNAHAEPLLRVLGDALQHAHDVEPARAELKGARLAAAGAIDLDLH
jgi:hypothetical protein